MASEEKGGGFDANAASKQMDLYSRAIAALGLDTMKNLSQLKVLIIGLRGVGVETAKNLILAGPKEVIVWDDGMVNIADLGANFYLKEEHVGKETRSQAVTKTLGELNPYVTVDCVSGELKDDFVQSFGAIVVTETLPRKELIRLNTLSRTRKIDGKVVPAAFVLAVTHGVSGHFFSDFGDAHVITDADGEPARSLVIEEFSPDGKISVATKRHGFDEVTSVMFEDLEGEAVSDDDTICLSELNGLEGVKVKRVYYKRTTKDAKTGKESTREIQVFDQLQLDLSETKFAGKKLGKHKNGGLINEIKAKQVKSFRAFEETLGVPAVDGIEAFFGPQHPDQGAWAEQQAGKTLHLLYNSALEFNAQEGRFMRLHDEDDSRKFKEIFEKMNEANKKEEKVSVDAIDKKRILSYSWYFSIELTGYCAFLGGIAAQEVVKKFGKYMPIFQWMHSDHIQLVGNQVPSDAIAQNCRYDHQITLFGKSFQQLLGNQRIFLVGTGALGCEYLKGLAMMGVCAGSNGKLWCTDMDRIEVSNLSRQFLFRANHVGQPKSRIASAVAKQMNPSFNVEALEMKVWSETEDFFDDEFWDNLDLCWNALDNVHARKYTDSKCLLHSKPLLESGTQGTKCNSEVIIPFKTKSYNDGEEQETEGIPMCTLQNFPYLPVHCIEWSRSSFSDNFETSPKTFNTFVENSEKFFEQVEAAQGEERVNMLKTVENLVKIQSSGVTFEECIRLAFNEYIQQHYIRIKNLIHTFPEDEIVKDKITGEVIGKFWSGHKRFPVVPKFSLDDENILQYLYCGANLHAFAFGLPQVGDKAKFKQIAMNAKLQVPQWTPTKVEVNEDEENDEKKSNNNNDSSGEQEALCDSIIKFLKSVSVSKLKKMNEIEFEKDDDSNYHIDYITICANTRAANYRIKETSRHQCKIIAGKIIAALATTTAMITGLVELEFYKLKLSKGFIEEDAFYNANINLAVSQFQYFQPDAAIRHLKEEKKDPVTNMTETLVPYPNQWTSWDQIVVDEGNLTVQEFVDVFPKICWGVEVELLHGDGSDSGVPLFNGSQAIRSGNMQKQQLARQNISEKMKEQLQKQLDSIEQWNANLKKGRDAKLIDRYLELYTKEGKLVSDKRNYVLLAGSFVDKDGNQAILPKIKYVFKH